MRNRHIARELFNRTRRQDFFTVNDFRKYNFDNLMSHPNQIGGFFGDLSKNGLAVKVGQDRAKHKEAKRRWIWKWIWTVKAEVLFGD